MRALAFCTYSLAGVFGMIAFFFGSGRIALFATYILLFGLAFHRIAALQQELLQPAAGLRRHAVLPMVLFSVALVVFAASFFGGHSTLLSVAIYLALFGCLFRGLDQLGAKARQATDDTTHLPPEA